MLKTNYAGDIMDPKIAQFIADNFAVGDTVYHTYRRLGKLTVTEINGYSIRAIDLNKTKHEWYYFRQMNKVGLKGTACSTMTDLQLAQNRYHIECNVEPPHGTEDEEWADYDAFCDFHSCIIAEQLTRAQNGGIWAMED